LLKKAGVMPMLKVVGNNSTPLAEKSWSQKNISHGL
jgi:hypothetical protein